MSSATADGKPRGWVGWLAPILIKRSKAKMLKASGAFLDEGERLEAAVPGARRPLAAVATPIEAAREAPGLLHGEHSRLVLLRTDRWLRVMHAPHLSIWVPTKELERLPLDTPVTCEVNADGSGGMLAVHDYRLYFGPYAVEDARKVAGGALP